MRLWLGALALVTAIAVPGVARAEDTSEAQQLFEEGRQLLEDGQTDAACDKFELSIAKDPRAVGTLLNLGLCNERRGKVATALRLFQEAFDRAGDASLPQHREAAQVHIAKLLPQVPVLVVTVTSPVDGQSVFVDDKGIKLGALELQLDPGMHKVVATAPGRLPYETTLKIAVGERTAVTIPSLEAPATPSARRLFGKVATVAGGGLVVAAGVMSVYAYRSYHQQFDDAHCATIAATDTLPARLLCDEMGQDATTRARTVATAATVIGAVGAVAVVGGIVLWLTAPAETLRITPGVSATGVSVMLSGRF